MSAEADYREALRQIDAGEAEVIRRSIKRHGRSRAEHTTYFANGRYIGEVRWIDIPGQTGTTQATS